jgi:thermitase
MINRTQLCKVIGILVVTALIVSSNVSVCTALSAPAGNSLHPPAFASTLTTANYAGTFKTAPQQYNWAPEALSSYADAANTVEIIIGVDNDASNYNTIAALAKENGAAVTDTIKMGEKSAVVVKVSTSLASEFVAEVQALDISNYIEPNGKYYVDSTPNDEYWSLQWGAKRVGADLAWNTTVGSDDLLVAVVDTGIDYLHPDLIANYVPLGYDFVNNDNDPKDDYGHGTHCAGIIAATINNTEGIAGIAKVKIMAEKGLGVDGSGSHTALANCIVNATNAGADIISNSWGGPSSDLISQAIDYATAHGALVLASAGNENTDYESYPAAYPDVIAVAAANTSDTKASFSNYGSWVDVSAPGVMIYSTMPTYHVTMNDQPRFTRTYSYANGTSMACPVAVGVAALIWSQHPSMTAEFVREQLEATCDDAGAPGFDVYFGYGIVNAQRGVEQPPVTHDLAAKNWVKPSFAMLGQPQSVNITVVNRGLTNETNVQVRLLVNGTTVDSAVIPTLAAYRTASAALSWAPAVVGTYNLTYYVVPAADETNFANNQLSTDYTVVNAPNSAGWTQIASNPNYGIGCNLKAAYSQMDTDVVFFKVAYYNTWSKATENIDTAMMIDVDQNISTGMPQGYYPGQANYMGSDFLILVGNEGTEIWRWNPITRDYDVNNPLNLIYLEAPEDSDTFVVGVSAGDLQTAGSMDCTMVDIYSFYNPSDSTWYSVWDWMPDSGYAPFVAYQSQHDLVVTLETPRIWTPQTALTITAKIFNFGQTSESNVNLKLYVNGGVVNSSVYTIVASDEYKTLTYTLQPTTGYYNITVYAEPVSGESNISNNQRSRVLPVSQKIALISDNTELWQTLNILDSMNINYDQGYYNKDQLYTANINILRAYPTVIYYNAFRNITVQEQAAFNAYLAAGGNLLVTGLDSLYYTDAKLADVVRATSTGDDVDSNDLIVVDASHHIMNSGYGHFAAGYQVTGLNRDNDAVEADRTRNATTVAELSDGKDKIVATDSLPGKVVFWNGNGTDNWLHNSDCTAIFKNTMLWFIDVTPPATTNDYNGQWWTSDFTINLSSSDYFGVSQTYYKINGGATRTVSANGQPLITAESSNNTLEYWSTDLYGHEETHHFLTQIKLDKTGPTGTLQIDGGGSYVTSTDVTLTLDASDSISGIAQIRYSNDGVWDTEPWEAMGTTRAWTLTAGDGEKTVYCSLKNNAGITSSVSTSTVLDTTQPNGSIVINGGATYTNTAQTNLALTLTDVNSNAASMCFRNENLTWSDWQVFSPLAAWNMSNGDGNKTVSVQFKDNAGLISTFNDTIILDTTSPIANAGPDQTVIYGNSVTLSASASSDSSDIVNYSWEFGDSGSGIGVNVTHTYPKVGTYTAKVTVRDAAGNNASDTAVITVKTASSSFSSSSSSSTPTTTPKPTATPTPSAVSNTIIATNDSGANVTLTIQGDIAASQISNATLYVNQTAGTTILSFTVTGENGTIGTGTIIIPKNQVPYGTEPTLYIDGVPADYQNITQDNDNYYITYTVHFSTHNIKVIFANTQTNEPTSDNTLLIVSALAAVACILAATGLLLRRREKTKN